MGYSDRCHDPKTYWDRTTLRCVYCPLKPGREITPNCGFDDNGGRHEIPNTKCKAGHFNDGSRAYCQACSSCPPGYDIVSPCSSTADTQCRDARNWRTTTGPPRGVSATFSTASTPIQGSTLTPNATTPPTTPHPPSPSHVYWAVPLGLAILLSTMLVTCLIYMKRKRGQHTICYNRRSSHKSEGFSPLSTATNSDLECILSPHILSAPLQTVLDNLDVLEELVILLDPESHGRKNTKHLASHCSFPSTWITYTYSMKDSKSPLKAVLEGVTSRHPDWTVGQLAKRLRHIERNDAIAVLAKLGLNDIDK
ncbi:IGF-like family receptor 1 [Micropterus dolomieu]|uniref:IGF-like family receptor 1 n=1 Tax=Micropterus dolomieu TaxID=147949 RepID=UPI001E8E9D0F|nr:IGF-like family receptor 1 [Micropterus dolomieu]